MIPKKWSGKLIGIGVLVGVIIAPFSVFAASPSVSDLQALIQQLQEQIKSLQAQVAELQTGLTSTKSDLEEVKAEVRFTKTLARGSRGDDVKELQRFLAGKFPDLFSNALITGYFGAKTEAAVKKLQEEQGLESVGVVGPKTLTKLNELVTQGAGSSGVIPPGLLTAPGLQGRVGTSTVSSTPAFIPPPVSTTTVPTTSATTSQVVVVTSTISTIVTTVLAPTPTAALTPTQTTTTTTQTTTSATTTPTTATSTTSTATSTTTISPSSNPTSGYIPAINSPPTPSNVVSTSITMSWTTTIPSDTTFDYGLTTNYGSQVTSQNLLTSHIVNLSNLNPGTQYWYRAQSAVSDGGKTVQSGSFRTLSTVVAPTNVQAVTTASSQNQPPQMWYYVTFNYTLQSNTQSFNIYRKRPSDASFVRYTYNAQTPVNPSILPLPGSGESNLYHRDPNQWSWYTTLSAPALVSAAGEYQFYVTAVDVVGTESDPSITKSLKIYAAPTISSPADGSTVSSPFSITVIGDPNAPSYSTYGMALYKQTTGNTAWSAWPAPSTNFIYPGTALNPSDNPHRLVVWLSADGSSFHGTSIFNVATTSASAVTQSNLAAIISSLAALIQELQRLLR